MSEWTLKLVTPPVTEPVSVAELKAHSRIVNDAEDATTIPIFISAAREWIETAIRAQIATATWDLFLDSFASPINIPLWPLQSVTSLKYYDQGGTQQTVDSTTYHADLDSVPGRLRLKYGQPFPITQPYKPNSVSVRFVAGMTAVPKMAKLAILVLAADWYENREDTSEHIVYNIPNGVMRIVNALRKGTYP